MYLTHVFPPMLSAALHGALVIMWAYEASLLGASDYTDPDHPSKMPYYISRGCGDPVDPSLRGYCQQATGSFAISILQAILFLVYFVFSVVSAFPSQEQKNEQREKEREENEWKDLENYENKDFEQELDQMHLPPNANMQQFPAYPLSPAKSAFGVYSTEVTGPGPIPSDSRLSMSSNGTGQMARPNKDLPLRHHITSDVYS